MCKYNRHSHNPPTFEDFLTVKLNYTFVMYELNERAFSPERLAFVA